LAMPTALAPVRARGENLDRHLATEFVVSRDECPLGHRATLKIAVKRRRTRIHRGGVPRSGARHPVDIGTEV
jgi:hypothetical protein